MDNLGFGLLAVLYVSIGLVSLIAPAIHKKIGDKNCLVYGALGHFCFVFCSILPAYRLDYSCHDSGSNCSSFTIFI